MQTALEYIIQIRRNAESATSREYKDLQSKNIHYDHVFTVVLFDCNVELGDEIFFFLFFFSIL